MKNTFPGLKYKVPKNLSHKWHERMLEDFTPYLDTFERFGELFGNKPGGWRTTRFWRSAVPDYRERQFEIPYAGVHHS